MDSAFANINLGSDEGGEERPGSSGIMPPNSTTPYQIDASCPPQPETGTEREGNKRQRKKGEDRGDRKHASISLPIPPDVESLTHPGRFRKTSGEEKNQARIKASENIQIHKPHPCREGSIASSRRSYSRGAFFGDVPGQCTGSFVARRMSTRSLDSDSNDETRGRSRLDNDDLGLGGSSAECESEIQAILGGASKSYMSRMSISMNKSVNPMTGETLFWGFSKKQWFLLFIFSIADLLAGVVYSLQAPFYPEEAEKKGAKPTEYGLVFGVFELAMFIVSPIYGKYMSKLGPRNVFNVGIFITGTCCVLFGLLDRINDKWTFICLSFAIRTLEAVGNAGFATATFTLIAMEFPDSVATTFASLETFFGFGLIVGPTLGGGLYQIGGYTLPFLVTGAMIFTTALLVAIFMPKSKPATENGDLTKSTTAGYGILTILKIPGVLLATMSIITGAISLGFLSSSLEPHIRQFNLSPFMTGLVFVINGGIYALTAPGWGWLCDRVKQTKYITLIGATFLTVSFLLIGPAPFIPCETILWMTCVGLFIQGLGVGATFVSSFILALRHSVASGLPDSVETYSVVSGLWSSVLALGLFIGPSAAGVLYDTVGFRWGSMLVVGFGVTLIFLILSFILCNKKGEEAYFRALSARSSSSSRSSSETDPLLAIKAEDDFIPDAVLTVGDENSINNAEHVIANNRQRVTYGATTVS